MATAPSLKITFSLTSNTYRRSLPYPEKPQLVITTILTGPENLVVELRNEDDNGSVLEDDFRVEHFEIYDLTTSLPVVHTPFQGTCQPRDPVYADGVTELSSSKPKVTARRLEDIDPGSDPMRQLEVGHEYRLKLRPQKVWAFIGTKAELFGDREYIPVKELPEGVTIELASDDEIVLTIEE